jgi:cytochrome P450
MVQDFQEIVNVKDLQLPKIQPKYFDKSKDIYERVEKEIEASKINWIADLGGLAYSIYGYENVTNILKDKRWHNGIYLLSDANPNYDERVKSNRRQLIINLEGMDHLRLRKIVGPVFSPKVADSLRPEMKKVINEIIDEIIDLDSFDLQKDILDKYPAYIIGKIIGVPQDDTEMFGEWADNTFKTFGGNFNADADVVKKTQKDLDKYTNNLITEKRKNPSNDLVSMLVNAEVDGEKLDDIEIACLIQAILIAGIDTTRCQLGLIFIILLSRPDLFNMIKNEDKVNEIVEECVRLDGVFKQLIRVASEDIEYNGVLFPKGTVVTPSLASAQFDDSTFENATEFKLDRPNAKNHTLSYGGGIHYCLGAALARAEIQEATKVIAQRLPNINLSGDIVYKKVYESVWGPKSIPVKKDTENE